jgi:iron(III) transport system ATP-binding protein
MAVMTGPLWRLNDVTLPGRRGPRLDSVSLDIPAGMTAILGPSGAGKSSLLNLLVEFERPASGTVLRSFASSKDRLPVFWSPPGHGLWPHLSVATHLTSLIHGSAVNRRQQADHFLQAFDLIALKQAYPGTLSQGERDRLSLARAIASGAQVLVLDEPLVHVQQQQSQVYWEFLRNWIRETGTSIVLATHDSQVVLREANHAVCLYCGRVMAAGRVDEVLSSAAN